MVPQSAHIIPEPIQFYRKKDVVSVPGGEADCDRFSVLSSTRQAYAATRQLAGHTGLTNLVRHASLTGNAYSAGYANFVFLGDLARLRISRT